MNVLVSVDNAGEITTQSLNADGSANDGDTGIDHFINTKNTLTINKTYTDNKRANSAPTPVFQLCGATDNQVKYTAEKAADSDTYTFSQIADGEYYIKETAPTGYVAQNNIPIKVTAGIIYQQTTAGAWAETGEIAPAIAVANAPEQVSVPVTKNWDYMTNSLATHPTSVIYELAISGSQSAPLHIDGTSVEPLTVTKTGTDTDTMWTGSFVELPKYVDGEEVTYVVTETVPEGYVMTKAADSNTFTNTENALTINKSFFDSNVDGNTATGESVTFGLYEKDAAVATEAPVQEAVLRADNTVLFSQIADGEYDLAEKTTGSSYIISKDKYRVTVADGAITIGNKPIGDEDTTTTSGTRVTKEYTNYVKGKFDFVKQGAKDAGYAALDGATFTLTDSAATSNVLTCVSGADALADGTVSFTGLNPGTYTLEETHTVNGYAIVTTPVTVTVNDRGEVTYKNGSADITIAQVTELFKNEKTKLIVQKLDDRGEAVIGAQLSLTGKLADNTNEHSWSSAAAAEDISQLLIGGETYTITETERLTGYLLATPITFTCNLDGSITVTSGAAAVNADADQSQINVFDSESNTFTVRDIVIQGSLKLKKTITTGYDETLKYEGLGFNLYYSKTEDGTYRPLETDGTANVYNLNDNGERVVSNLEEGYYYFQEVTTQDGLYLDTTKSATMYIGTADHETAAQTGTKFQTVNMANVQFDTTVTLTKTDAGDENSIIGAAGDIIQGAEFTLYKADASDPSGYKEVTAFTTDDAGKWTYTMHSKGTYKIVETKAAKGYVLGDTPYTAEFTVDNTVDFQSKTLDLSAEADDATTELYGLKVTNSVGYTEETAGIANTRDTGNVTLTKVDGADQKALNGVTFTLYKKNVDGLFDTIQGFFTGKTYTEVNETEWNEGTAADGVLTIAGLSWGDYYIQETGQLDGYGLIDTKHEFTINKATGSDVALTVGIDTIENAQTNISIAKTNMTGVALEGAQFSLVPSEGNTFADKTTEAITWTGDAGYYDITGKLITSKAYELTETKAPAGYKLLTKAFTITLNEDGTLQVIDETNAKSEGNNLVIKDEPIQLIVAKYSPQGQRLEGCVFSVRGIFAMESGVPAEAEETLIVDDEHQDILEGRLIAGNTYTLTEMTAPDGFATGGSVQFLVNEDGTVTMQGTSTEYKIDETTGQLQMQDDPTTVKLAKVDSTGKALAGSTFTVTGKFADGKTSKTFSPTTSGALEITELFVEGEQYTLAETKAPSGYDKMSGTVKFTVSAKNQVKLDTTNSLVKLTKAEETGIIKHDVYTITVTNNKTPAKKTTTTTAKKTGTTTKAKTATKTGDETDLALWMAMMMLAGSGIVLAGRKKRKEK